MDFQATFQVERTTKRTVRYAEIVPSQFADPKIGTLYIQKSALGLPPGTEYDESGRFKVGNEVLDGGPFTVVVTVKEA